MTSADKPWHTLRRSRIHGTGVYAARKIPAGTRVFEYEGEIISPDEADRRHPVNPDDPFHTFFFALGNDTVIDGNVNGNDARWVNHSCEPNCETEETDDYRVYIVALRDIPRGEELFFDYGLVLDERITKTVREQYKCLCGTPACRGTMLALKRRPAAKATPAKAGKSDKTDAKKAAGKKATANKATAKKAVANDAAAKKAGGKRVGKATGKTTKKAATKAVRKAAQQPVQQAAGSTGGTTARKRAASRQPS